MRMRHTLRFLISSRRFNLNVFNLHSLTSRCFLHAFRISTHKNCVAWRRSNGVFAKNKVIYIVQMCKIYTLWLNLRDSLDCLPKQFRIFWFCRKWNNELILVISYNLYFWIENVTAFLYRVYFFKPQ